MIVALVVDDEKDIRDMLTERLEIEYDCWVDVQSSAEWALKSLRRRPFDLIFCDYKLLGSMNGLNFLQEVHSRGEKCVTVLMTGFMREVFDKVLSGEIPVEPDELVMKPFPDDFLSFIMNKYFMRMDDGWIRKKDYR